MTDLEESERIARKQGELERDFERQDRQQEDADYAAVLGTEAGRRVFAAIFLRGGVYGSVWKNCGGDATRLAYETGRREMAIEIFRKANLLQPELVMKAIQERNAVIASRKKIFEQVRENERSDA